VRGLIAYDSYYGNGAQVAAAIAEELRAAAHDVRVVDLHHERAPIRSVAAESEFLVLGGPTRMKHISRRARSFAKKLDATVWDGRPALVYDTYGPLDPDPARNTDNKWLFPGGVAELRQLLQERGLIVASEDLRCLVTLTKGPLAEGALDEARAAARRFTAQLIGAARRL
jgi:flavodoxin